MVVAAASLLDGVPETSLRTQGWSGWRLGYHRVTIGHQLQVQRIRSAWFCKATTARTYGLYTAVTYRTAKPSMFGEVPAYRALFRLLQRSQR